MSRLGAMNTGTILSSINDNGSISCEELEFLVRNQTYIYEIIAQGRNGDKRFKGLFDKFVQQEWGGVKQRNDNDDVKLSAGIRFSINSYGLERLYESRKIQMGRVGSMLIAGPIIPEIQSIFGDPDNAVFKLKQLVTDYKLKKGNRGVLLLLGGDSCIGKGETTDRLVKYLNNENENSAFTISLGNVFRAIRRRIILDRKLHQVNGNDTADKLKKIVMDEEYMSKLANELNYIEDGELDGKNVTWEGDDVNLNVSEIPDPLIPIIAEYSQHIAIQAARRYIDTKLSKGMDVVVEGRDQTLDFFEDGHEKTLRRKLVVEKGEGDKFATARAISNLFKDHQNQFGENVTCKEICTILAGAQ